MSNVLKRIEIPIALTIIATLLQVIPYYFDLAPVQSAANTMQTIVLIIVAMATFVGVISILQVHGKRIQRQSEGWYYSAIVVLGTLIMAITGLPLPEFGLGITNSIIVLVAGTLMVMSNAPLFVNAFSPFADIGLWIRNVPNMATMRGVMIGAALGAIALAMRTLMGIERGYLRGGGEE
ncbi:MAG: hypothetical protein ACWGQW_06175 [bacterium]